MRRGSISTYADDGRRHSEGITGLPRDQRNSSNRHEFSMNDEDDEKTGGCYISYRSIAFAFVFFLAFVIAAAFIGVYIGTPPEKDLRDGLVELSKDNVSPERYTLAASVKPQRYRIELEPTVESEKGDVGLKGRVAIDFVKSGPDAPTQLVLNSKEIQYKSYRLYAVGSPPQSTASSRTAGRPESETAVTEPDVRSTTLSATADEPITKTELKITGNKTEESEHVYVISLEHPLRDGNYSLEIEYEARLDSDVVFVKNFTKNDGNRLIMATKLKPVNAPRLFPTFNEAKLKANFTLTVIHPTDTKVLSNTPLTHVNESSGNTTASRFAETRPMSAHNLALVLGSNESLAEIITDQKVVFWGDADSRFQDFYLRNKISLVLATFTEIFEGVALPVDKLDVVALPLDFQGVSSPGIIVIKESLLRAGSPLITRTRALRKLIGLVGQQWLGGLVDAKNWTDAWFIESSILHLQYALLDKIDSGLNASDDFLVDVQLDVMENDGYLITKSLDSKVDQTHIEAFDLADNYKKGACLLSMLHGLVNGSDFMTGYADFLRRWSYGNADSDELVLALAGNATVRGANESSDATSLAKAFASWSRQPGYPLITVTWHRNNDTVTIRQGKFNFDELSNTNLEKVQPLWWVPLTYVADNGDWSEPAKVWLEGKEQLTLKDFGRANNNSNSWVIFNVDKKGYYRVNYDPATWLGIISTLRERPAAIPALTRAALIDDALSLAQQGSLEYATALELVAYLGAGERDYAPWKAFARHAYRIDFALFERYSDFRDFVKQLVAPVFDELEQKIIQGSPLAMLAAKLACSFEYQKCTNWAKNKWENIFKNNAENTLAEHIRKTVYCIGAQRGGEEELSYLTRNFEEANDRDEKNRLLYALGCFDDPRILQKILHDTLHSENFEGKDVRAILKSYARHPAAAQAARRFVQENWEMIVKRFSHSYWTMKAFIQASTSLLSTEFDLKEFSAFRDDNIDSLKAMGHWVALNNMKATQWIFRLKESQSDIQKWFKSHTNSTVRYS